MANFDHISRLNTALAAVRVLRSSVGQIFETLGSGVRAEENESKYLIELQEQLNAVTVNLR